MKNKTGVMVETEDGSIGYIVRRLNAESYEIAISDEVVILSPKEFKEIQDEK
jgi:hypothetical protein